MSTDEDNVKDPNAKTIVNRDMFEGRQRPSDACPTSPMILNVLKEVKP